MGLKIKPLLNKINKNKFIQEYLKALGVEDINLYLNPDSSCLDDVKSYPNMEKAANLLFNAVTDKYKIGLLVDVDCDGDLWVDWPFESCEANKIGSHTWCCAKKQCLLIDTNVKGNIKKGDKIVYLGTMDGFKDNGVWPNKVTTGVVNFVEGRGVCVDWDDPNVVGERFHGHTHVWYEDIAKVIPWD